MLVVSCGVWLSGDVCCLVSLDSCCCVVYVVVCGLYLVQSVGLAGYVGGLVLQGLRVWAV